MTIQDVTTEDTITRNMTLHEMAARSVQARARIAHHIYQTPLIQARGISLAHTRLLFKAENFQVTGSFKIRGAMAKISSPFMEGRLITASSGNHGIASSYAARILAKNLVVVLPQTVVASKLEKIRASGVDVILHGEESGQAEARAQYLAEQEGYHYISPYNDWDIIAGQGTIGLELLEQCDFMDNIFISMGGGGLISGIACVMKAFNPKVKIYGVAAKNSQSLALSMAAGKVVETTHQETLADGVAGGIDADCLTLPLAMAGIDDVVVCDEEEIATALKNLGQQENMIVEGAAALAYAGFAKISRQCTGQTNIVVLCGANFDTSRIHRIIFDH